jgi:FkbM family methyltransferase
MKALIENILANIERALSPNESGLSLQRLPGITEEVYFEAFSIIQKYSQLVQGKGYITSHGEEITFAVQLLGELPKLAIDIGGNVGSWTKHLLDIAPDAKVIMFEPQSFCMQELQTIFRDKAVTILNLGVSNTPGHREIYAPHAGSPLATTVFPDSAYGHVERVTCVRLDEFLAPTYTDNELIDIIKLDTEGSEYQALLSAERILAMTKIVQFEYGFNAVSHKVFFRDFYQYLSDLGFEIFRATPLGLRRIKDYSYDEEALGTTTFYARSTSLSR